MKIEAYDFCLIISIWYFTNWFFVIIYYWISFYHQKVGQYKLGKAIFASGCAFSLVENKYWKEFFEFIRPIFQVPTRNKLSKQVLNEVYTDTKQASIDLVANSKHISLVVDGWTNTRNEGIINTIAVVENNKPVFWKSTPTG